MRLSAMAALRPMTDGVVTIRPFMTGDSPTLVAGRDETFHRFLGPGSDDPRPVGCIVVNDQVVGWVDYDVDCTWLEPGEVNLGYNLFAPHRGQGYATRAVQLLMHHLAVDTEHQTATLLIHPQNHRSLALAARARFTAHGQLDGSRYFQRPVPPLTYTDATVTIRWPSTDDLDADLEAKDDAQMDWLWRPGERQSWAAMTSEEQRAHALLGLRANHRAFGTGPKWTFAVDAADAPCVAYIDCDLANEHVPPGEANVSYSSHPAHRGRGYVSSAVRLLTQFLADHTGARLAHLVVDEGNVASLRVAAAVGARATERWSTHAGRVMIRHVMPI